MAATKGETTGARVDELHRRMTNAILPEGGSAHVEELNDPYLLWFWNSNVRSTAITLRSLMRDSSSDTLVRQTVRWLLNARKNGRWGNTQENAMAMEALVAYYRKYESQMPDFRAVVKLATDEIARETFQGRSTEAATRDIPMTALTTKAPGGSQREISFTRDGKRLVTIENEYVASVYGGGGRDSAAHLWDLATGKGLRLDDTRHVVQRARPTSRLLGRGGAWRWRLCHTENVGTSVRDLEPAQS